MMYIHRIYMYGTLGSQVFLEAVSIVYTQTCHWTGQELSGLCGLLGGCVPCKDFSQLMENVQKVS